MCLQVVDACTVASGWVLHESDWFAYQRAPKQTRVLLHTLLFSLCESINMCIPGTNVKCKNVKMLDLTDRSCSVSRSCSEQL